MNPRPLGPEDWTENSMGAFRLIWCCLLQVQLLSKPLPSNASVRSRRGLGQRLGQGKTVPPHEKQVERKPRHHLLESPLSIKWWGKYEQDE